MCWRVSDARGVALKNCSNAWRAARQSRRSCCSAPIPTCARCAATRLSSAYVPEGVRDWAVARLSAREAGWDEILQRAQTLPMLAPRQVIIVERRGIGRKARRQIARASARCARKVFRVARAVYRAAAGGRGARRPAEILQTAERKGARRELDDRRRIRGRAGRRRWRRTRDAEIDRDAAVSSGGDSEWRARAHPHRDSRNWRRTR